jgi:hypothetical protein
MTTDTVRLIEALDYLKVGGFVTGKDWEKAHAIAQSHEGDPDHDWLHALCHRIEGDDANAGYWYRRAGRARFEGTIEAEHDGMRSAFERRL